MGRKKTWPPRVHYNRARGSDSVRINGQEVYLGPHGSEVARRCYLEVVGEAERHGGALLPKPGPGLTVAGVCAAYWEHYRARGLSPALTARVKLAVDTLARAHGAQAVADFRPAWLREIQRRWLEAGEARSYAHAKLGHLRALFRWAAEEDLLPAGVAEQLWLVRGLREGRIPEPRGPVEPALVTATLPELTPTLRAMVLMQQHSGMRPCEVCRLRPADVLRPWKTFDGCEVWLYSPRAHKGTWRGHARDIPLGPQAQAVLTPFLGREREEPCFLSVIGLPYPTWSYNDALHRAQDRAGIDRWTANQLRKLKATELDCDEGLDAASCVLGHRNGQVTAIHYAARLAKAGEMAARYG